MNSFMKNLTICFLIALTENVVAQEKIRELPLNLSIGSHSFNLPYRQPFRTNPYYPSVIVGTEFIYRSGKRSKIYQSGNAGYFHNSSTGDGISLNSEFGFRYTLPFGLFADVSFGPGYLHRFHPRTIYKLNGNGEYVKATDTGKACFMGGFTNTIGYDLSTQLNLPISVFVRYQWFFQTPHFKDVLPGFHSIMQTGIRVNNVR